MREAMLYEKLPDNKVRCDLCAHHCKIAEGKKGICYVRENQDGILYTLVYGRTIARNVDPIEKKPLFHFQPGTTSYSIATPGCNFHCDWCQNADISQMPRERDLVAGIEASPEEIVAAAKQSGCRSISYTYTEPTIFFEYTYETAHLAHEAGLSNVYVSNGYMSSRMLEFFHPLLDAINVDLKAFREETYHKYVGGALQPILDNLKALKGYGVFLEVTTLVIPGINDAPEELHQAVDFIVNELGVDTPWHISRFHPMYRMKQVPSTPLQTLETAMEIGKEAGLRYVYIGNVPGSAGENTVCYSCGNLVVERVGYHIRVVGLDGSRCKYCGTELNFRI
ncbi:MAG: AmmeMemoRadiSam system radical SAM enzyme [Dehalococcoidia bacterium]